MKFTTWYNRPIEVAVDLGPDEFQEFISELATDYTEDTERSILRAINKFAEFFQALPDESLEILSQGPLNLTATWFRTQDVRLKRIANEKVQIT